MHARDLRTIDEMLNEGCANTTRTAHHDTAHVGVETIKRHLDVPLDVRRQRSLQYLTSSQTRSHFFRHAKGFSQTRQSLVGRLGFL